MGSRLLELGSELGHLCLEAADLVGQPAGGVFGCYTWRACLLSRRFCYPLGHPRPLGLVFQLQAEGLVLAEEHLDLSACRVFDVFSGAG